MLSKSEIRKSIRDQRKNLSLEQVSEASKKIAEKTIHHPAFINAQKIAYYMSHENEIDPAIIINHARELKKELYLPIISDQNELQFYLINSNTQFKKNKFDIDEPIIKNQQPISPQQFDLILMPLVAFDEHCHRIGRGAGHYDRALQNLKNKQLEAKPIIIGLAYEFQRVSKIISESHDVTMNYVITELSTYSAS